MGDYSLLYGADVMDYLNWFSNVKLVCMPEISPTWSWYMVIFICYSLIFLLENYTCISMRDHAVVFLVFLSGLGIRLKLT